MSRDDLRLRASQVLFGAGIILCVSPWGSSQLALALGAALALTLGNPYAKESSKISKLLLQASVVLLGFGMDFSKVLGEGKSGLLFALVSISSVFALGWALSRFLRVAPVTSLLVSAGTAICGGSAIAAIGAVIRAKDEDMSVAVGTVFLLNAVALFLFPTLGHAMNLNQGQFGTWAGIAIHDVASVVGAGQAYGTRALEVATTVKLSRVLYLIPITLIVAHWSPKGESGKGSRPTPPWFIGLFIVASLIRSAVPFVAAQAPEIKLVASAGFSCALFLIGAGISRATLAKVGFRPLVQGLILWAFISIVGLVAVRQIS